MMNMSTELMKQTVIFIVLFQLVTIGFAQNGVIQGKVQNPVNNSPIPFANVVVLGVDQGTITDEEGNYRIDGLEPGLYNVKASFVGFKSQTQYEIQVGRARAVQLDFQLEEEASDLDEVVVSSEFSRSEDTPISARKLNTNEIERYPGGNRDISRVIQSLPGVASTASFRNDIIIRGRCAQ
jgi:hypothetical protein